MIMQPLMSILIAILRWPLCVITRLSDVLIDTALIKSNVIIINTSTIRLHHVVVVGWPS